MGLDQVYCTICGAPMLESGCTRADPDKEWLADAILLTTAHKTDHGVELDEYWPPSHSTYSYRLGPNPPPDSTRTVLRLDADAHGATFRLAESGEQIVAMFVHIPMPTPTTTHGAPLYLPVHRLCLELADRFIQSTSTSLYSAQAVPPAGITSVLQLWEVLYRRLTSQSNPPGCLPSPQDYFGGRLYRNVSYEPGDDPTYASLHEQDPIHIPSLTTSLLQNLVPINLEDPKAASQNWYFESLFNTQVFPWLWDLDLSTLHSQQATGKWDWSHLAHLLSQKCIQDPLDATMNLSPQLRNRRRIWRLLSEAWVGDISQREEELKVAMKQGEEKARELSAVAPPHTAPPPGFQPPPGFPSFPSLHNTRS